MKVKCINNKGVERFLIKGKVYEVIECHEEHFVVACDVSSGSAFAKGRFEIVPSIDDVIKDKEKEKRTMNGFEALKLMQEGKMIKGGIWIYRTDSDGVIWLKNESCTGWVEAEMFNILANDYEEYIEPKPLTGWERTKDDKFHLIVCGGQLVAEYNLDKIDVAATTFYNDANYFSTKEKAEEITFKQTLFRKLQRFSDENGGTEIDWSDFETNKHTISYYHSENKFTTHHVRKMQAPGTVYFYSREIAEKAIESFKGDLIKYFTHDWSGKNE